MKTDDYDDRPIVDTSVPLDNGWRVGWAVYPDGGSRAWLLSPERTDPAGAHPAFGCACADCAPHEQLSDPQRIRLNVGPPRCGRPASHGGRCESVVRRPGDPCRWHRDQDRTSRRREVPRNTDQKGKP